MATIVQELRKLLQEQDLLLQKFTNALTSSAKTKAFFSFHQGLDALDAKMVCVQEGDLTPEQHRRMCSVIKQLRGLEAPVA